MLFTQRFVILRLAQLIGVLNLCPTRIRRRSRCRLPDLKQEHDDYHAAIDAMTRVGCNPLQIQRLKKKKLDIKDQLAQLEGRCIPDIIA